MTNPPLDPGEKQPELDSRKDRGLSSPIKMRDLFLSVQQMLRGWPRWQWWEQLRSLLNIHLEKESNLSAIKYLLLDFFFFLIQTPRSWQHSLPKNATVSVAGAKTNIFPEAKWFQNVCQLFPTL